MMIKRSSPTMEELENHAKLMSEINPSAVMIMLQVMQASAQIQHAIFDVLAHDYQLSEGKLRVLIILHQQTGDIAPSDLAQRAHVTRATISVMLKRMQRDGIITLTTSPFDARSKHVRLTEAGTKLINEVLPKHYLRISKLMHRLSQEEQQQLINLLRKITLK